MPPHTLAETSLLVWAMCHFSRVTRGRRNVGEQYGNACCLARWQTFPLLFWAARPRQVGEPYGNACRRTHWHTGGTHWHTFVSATFLGREAQTTKLLEENVCHRTLVQALAYFPPTCLGRAAKESSGKVGQRARRHALPYCPPTFLCHVSPWKSDT